MSVFHELSNVELAAAIGVAADNIRMCATRDEQGWRDHLDALRVEQLARARRNWFPPPQDAVAAGVGEGGACGVMGENLGTEQQTGEG